MQRGLGARASHNVDYGGETEYMVAQGGSTANERMVAAGFSSAGKDLVNNIFGLFGGKSAIRNLATARNGTLDTRKYTFLKMRTPGPNNMILGEERIVNPYLLGKWKVPKKQPRFVDAEDVGGWPE
ncbi:hypothetical protein [Hydrogenimonas sp.]